MLLECRINATLSASPRHHRGIRAQSTFQYLIPTDDLLAIFRQDFLHSSDDIALEPFLGGMLAISLQVLILDALLTSRTILPTHLRALITTDMEVFAWEERHHLTEHILQETEHILLARA